MAFFAAIFAKNFNLINNCKMTSNVNVCLTDEIRLEKALKGAGVKNPASVVKLTVSGKFY